MWRWGLDHDILQWSAILANGIFSAVNIRVAIGLYKVCNASSFYDIIFSSKQHVHCVQFI